MLLYSNESSLILKDTRYITIIFYPDFIILQSNTSQMCVHSIFSQKKTTKYRVLPRTQCYKSGATSNEEPYIKLDAKVSAKVWGRRKVIRKSTLRTLLPEKRGNAISEDRAAKLRLSSGSQAFGTQSNASKLNRFSMEIPCKA